MNLKITKTFLEDVLVIEPEFYEDDRGSFFESFSAKNFSHIINKKVSFVLDCHSHSKKNVIRGLHYQFKFPQGKLIRVLDGEIQDVVVDLRKNSKTFGKYLSINLSSNSLKQLWIPPGFAHGFLAKTETVDVLYKMTDYWNKDDENCIKWNDETLNIKWEVEKRNALVSLKDNQGICFKKAKLF